MSTEEMATPPGRTDIRPVVASRSTDRSILLFVGVAILGAGLLFYVLESRRASSQVADLTVPTGATSNLIASPPPLEIPQVYDGPLAPEGRRSTPFISAGQLAFQEGSSARRHPAPVTYAPPVQIFSPPSGMATPRVSDDNFAAADNIASPTVVFNSVPGRPTSATGGSDAGTPSERVTATRFQNPSTTIPKGTVIQAVLETALDSTRAGFARAIVSRDIFGFDGTEILIPRGSRLVGEYKADLVAGQKRALIQWQRLMRPDGAMINLDSPAADPLGRAGVQGKVDSHFLERFSGAILQSALSIGVQLATQSASRDSVVVALPGSLQGVTTIQPEKIQPTLKVRHGSSVSVFVSRDLDFSAVSP
ncbi:conjugation TrbI family protein [Sphingobium chlorophenolicum L-1]|uniref:Conjugation TrbI family protein n=1 Tax=Sphingobium chlorophenolicum L-1 TaxID=690566 RepID=F6EY65_SPHCR|nr:TrbI/VirB10 family protein [Sphingobium chlorophenolicum]AEG49171.1 conjugation TrbI family protein [Sphingobium chlorophenolicum L-1]